VRATYLTCIGLGVESPVLWIVVFVPTLFTHPEMFHGCVRSIIGDVINNGISGTAVGAVDERILMATVTRVQELMKAVFTYGNIGGDECLRASII